MLQRPDADDIADLRNMLVGYQTTQILHTTAALRIVDHLVDHGPATTAGIATATQTNPEPLGYVLDILCCLGMLTCDGGWYAVTRRGRLLDSRRPDGLWPTVAATGDGRYDSWGHLPGVLRTGQPAFPAGHGAPLHDYYAAHPDSARPFNQAMAALTRQTADVLVDAYDFGRHKHLVEVGGGLGVLMRAVLRTHPPLRGTIVDLPHVIDDARPIIAASSLADRCGLVAGDARQAVPTGADLYMFKMVLCDFPDADAQSMLAACRAGVTDDGRLVVIDKIRRLGHGDHADLRTLMSALNLAVMTGGTERTEQQYAGLLDRAGWHLADVTRTDALGGELHLLVADPA